MFDKYIVPVLIILAIAALLAFLLSFLGEKLKVERDPVIDKIRENLCGANCGGCGYAGCDAFAEALYQGKADVNKCCPTSIEGKEKIATLLGKEVKLEEPTVAVVHCNGVNSKISANYVGYKNCKAAASVGGGRACSSACLGYGSCKEVCSQDAISIVDGVSVIDKTKCGSCGSCINECPYALIGRVPKSAKVYIACSNKCKGKEVIAACQNGCIACGLCEKNCPSGAITLKDNLAQIDYTKCNGCMTCVSKCPKKCIKQL